MILQGKYIQDLKSSLCAKLCYFYHSNGIHVYVFDSGINVDHPDFGGRAHMEASFIDYEDDTDHAGHGKYLLD